MQKHVYHSADSLPDQAQQHLYPMTLLNSLAPLGCPPHQLRLKEGLPIMLLRNLNNAHGLANGTRLFCRRFFAHLIEIEVPYVRARMAY